MLVSASKQNQQGPITALGQWTFDLRIVCLLCMGAAVTLAAQSQVLALPHVAGTTETTDLFSYGGGHRIAS